MTLELSILGVLCGAVTVLAVFLFFHRRRDAANEEYVRKYRDQVNERIKELYERAQECELESKYDKLRAAQALGRIDALEVELRRSRARHEERDLDHTGRKAPRP